MEDHEDKEVTLDGREIAHLPGVFVFYERSGIENVGRIRPPSTLDPGGIDNVDRESSQTPSIDIVPMRSDGLWTKSRTIKRRLRQARI